MLQLKPLALCVAFGLATIGTVNLHAQDRPDDRRDQGSAQDHRPPPAEHSQEHGDDVERYRKAHPGRAARCHDGFFTRTTDRGRACTKHGGIDVWLL